jgi:hypothetical protein
MLTQTNQMMTQMMEIAKTNNSNNINNGTINNNNNYNQFNLQLYLNETCKNAMTIDEFLDYLQPTLEELEATAHLGYVEGITRIIMRGLKDLEEELRPFHCSDLKRESLFVKNPDGEWEKETDEKPLMLKFVKAVARKNFNNVNKYIQLNTDNYTRFVILRFDIIYNINITQWNQWNSNGIILPSKDITWNNTFLYNDIVFIIDSDYKIFNDAVITIFLS